jgi:NADPH:quinone reductase-like Zn-dependent oxidoreductase
METESIVSKSERASQGAPASSASVATMQAVVQDRYGSADVLQLRELDRPGAGAGEVVVRVRAAGVDQGAWHLMAGQPYLMRLLGFGLRGPKERVRGRDLAGVVEAVGTGVTSRQPGDEVFGTCRGSFAEYAATSAERLARKPADITFEQAGAIAISGSAALQAVRDHGRVRAGQRVLITGAGGGVGSFAVQLAKASGAVVTGVCSGAKADLVRSMGADHVIDYTKEDFTCGPERYDVILDIAGRRPLSHLRRVLAPDGTLVIVGGGGKLLGIGRQLRALILSRFVSQRLTAFVAKERRQDLETLRQLIEAGQVIPVIDRTFSLADAAEAIRYVHAGHARGKVVIAFPTSQRAQAPID